MKSFKNVAVTVLCILLSSCDDSPSAPSEDRLTPITSVGANTFSCRVNGQIWIPNQEPNFFGIGYSFLYANLSKDSATNSTHLWVYASRSRTDNSSGNFNESSSISISIDSINSIGTYTVNMFNADSTMKKPGTQRTSILTNGMNAYDGYLGEGSGIVHITTLDTIKKIVSGTFFFKVPKKNGGELIITDGRFDLKIE